MNGKKLCSYSFSRSREEFSQCGPVTETINVNSVCCKTQPHMISHVCIMKQMSHVVSLMPCKFHHRNLTSNSICWDLRWVYSFARQKIYQLTCWDNICHAMKYELSSELNRSLVPATQQSRKKKKRKMKAFVSSDAIVYPWQPHKQNNGYRGNNLNKPPNNTKACSIWGKHGKAHEQRPMFVTIMNYIRFVSLIN